MSAAQRKWVERTIREGAVTIYGVEYRPSRQWHEYDGRLDGMRYLFGRYRGGNGGWLPYVYLHSPVDHEGEDPQIIDGGYSWMFWFAEGKEPVWEEDRE